MRKRIQVFPLSMLCCFVVWLGLLYAYQAIRQALAVTPIHHIQVLAEDPSLVSIVQERLVAVQNKPINDGVLETLRQTLSQTVEYAGLEWHRLAPDAGRLHVYAHHFIAQINTPSGVAWLTEQGRLITHPKQSPASDLPVLTGEAREAQGLWRQYQRFEPIVSEQAGFHLQGLSCPESAYFEIRLDNGITIILEKEASEAQLARAIKLLTSTFHEIVDQIAYMDMRYEKGCALGFKSGHNRVAL